MSSSCLNCSFKGERLSTHWNLSDKCEYPELNQKQISILTGVIMGDGSVDTTSSNPRISCSNINKEYLKYLDSNFPHIGLGVTLENTAEDCASRDRTSEFNKDASKDNYSDIYRWRTRTHPKLSEFSKWYGREGKTFPENISLSPTILRHWYVCDGCYVNSGRNNYIEIGVSNENSSKNKLNRYFSEENLPQPKFDISERSNGSINASIRWSVQDSKELFQYMGGPVPGFKHKWP